MATGGCDTAAPPAPAPRLRTISSARYMQQAAIAEKGNADLLRFFQQHLGDKVQVYGDQIVVEHDGAFLVMPISDKDREMARDALAGGEAAHRMDELLRTGTYRPRIAGVQDHEVVDEVVLPDQGQCVLDTMSIGDEAWLDKLRFDMACDAASYRTMLPITVDYARIEARILAVGGRPLRPAGVVVEHGNPADHGAAATADRLKGLWHDSMYLDSIRSTVSEEAATRRLSNGSIDFHATDLTPTGRPAETLDAVSDSFRIERRPVPTFSNKLTDAEVGRRTYTAENLEEGLREVVRSSLESMGRAMELRRLSVLSGLPPYQHPERIGSEGEEPVDEIRRG